MDAPPHSAPIDKIMWTTFLLCALASSPSADAFAPPADGLPAAFAPTFNASLSAFRRGRTSRGPSADTALLRAVEDDDGSNAADSAPGTWNPFSLLVLKLGFTEPAWTSPLNYNKNAGTYRCASCDAPLFPSAGKFDSGSGWPSFWKTIESDRVALKREWDGRIEASCAACGGHLGHVFPDGPTRGSLDAAELATVPESDPEIGYKDNVGGAKSEFSRMPRYCINGVAMRFEEEGK